MLVLVSDDLKELDPAARRLNLAHQVCHFHVLRWLWRALRDLHKQLEEEHHPLVDQVWQIMKARPPDGRTRLYALWRGIEARRSRDQKTSALYRLRLLILRLHENWEKCTCDQARSEVLPDQQCNRTGYREVAHPQSQHAGLQELGRPGSSLPNLRE
jgi:hypothetical protein